MTPRMMIGKGTKLMTFITIQYYQLQLLADVGTHLLCVPTPTNKYW